MFVDGKAPVEVCPVVHLSIGFVEALVIKLFVFVFPFEIGPILSVFHRDEVEIDIPPVFSVDRVLLQVDRETIDNEFLHVYRTVLRAFEFGMVVFDLAVSRSDGADGCVEESLVARAFPVMPVSQCDVHDPRLGQIVVVHVDLVDCSHAPNDASMQRVMVQRVGQRLLEHLWVVVDGGLDHFGKHKHIPDVTHDGIKGSSAERDGVDVQVIEIRFAVPKRT